MSLYEATQQAEVPTQVRRVLHVPAGGGKATWLSGDVYSVKAGAAETGGSIAVLEASVPPGGGPPRTGTPTRTRRSTSWTAG